MTQQQLATTDLAYALLHAADVMGLVLRHGSSLDQALAEIFEDVSTPQAQGAVQDLAYFGLRWFGRGQVLTRLITNKPVLAPVILNELMALCFALIWDEEAPKYPAHTVVNQAVQACAMTKSLAHTKGLMNACLRSFLRDRGDWMTKALLNPLAVYGFPDWWVDKVKSQHPKGWETILEQSNTHPPLVLRVNKRCMNAVQYVKVLADADVSAFVLDEYTVLIEKPVSVSVLPGFFEGHVSVQDSAAQMAAHLLNPQNGQRVLDACAAPGGKTGHLLELADINLLAIDSSAKRLRRVEENIRRLAPTLGENYTVRCVAAEAQNVAEWWDGQSLDAILGDLPCSGSGVVRRHPDIRWLRSPEDVARLSQIQHKILDTLWSTLRSGGTLLLATCSIFSEEGPLLASAFLKNHPDAEALDAPGVVLPKPNQDHSAPFSVSPDGFFYAKFIKKQIH